MKKARAEKNLLRLLFLSLVMVLLSGNFLGQQTREQGKKLSTLNDDNRKQYIETLLKRLRQSTPGEVGSNLNAERAPRYSMSEDGCIRSLVAPANHSFAALDVVKGDHVQTTKNFITENGYALGINSPYVDFKLLKEKKRNGRNIVRLQQEYHNVPIFSGELITHINSQGGIEYLSSDILRDTRVLDDGILSIAPTLSKNDAQKAAINFVSDEENISGLEASPAELTIYGPSIVGNTGPVELVWQTRIVDKKASGVNELVLVNAHSGKVELHLSNIRSAINREISDASNTESNGIVRRSENDPEYIGEGSDDINKVYSLLADAYNYYKDHHGRDSVDNNGHVIRATVRYCPSDEIPPWRDAEFSDGGVLYTERLHFGDDYLTDDMVAHEYTHWVTYCESNLTYLNQSGAIDEAFSDIFATFVDFDNGDGDWWIGEGLPVLALRYLADPPVIDINIKDKNGNIVYSSHYPDRMSDTGFYTGELDNGGVHINSTIISKLAYLLAEGTAPGDDFYGYVIDKMGLSKTADLFYMVEDAGLPSSADFWDLSDALARAAIINGWSDAECENLENACRAVEISHGIMDITTSSLIQDRQGTVDVDIVAPSAGDFYVGIRAGDGGEDMGWTWPFTESSPVSLGFLDKHTFKLWVTPTDLDEPFEIVLKKSVFSILADTEVDSQLVTFTAQEPESDPPSVLSYSFGISRYGLITVKFDEDMDNASFSDSAVHVVGSASGTHACYYGFDSPSDTLVIDSIAAFEFGETITVTIGTGVKDVSGNNLPSPYEFSFSIEDVPTEDNVPPSLDFTAPTGAESTESGYYVVRWTDADPDSNALITLYYDTDTNFGNGHAAIRDENGIAASIYEDSNQNSFFWDTSSVSVGTYYIVAVLEDQVNPPVIKYSTGTVEVRLPASGTQFELSSQASWVWDDENPGNNQTYVNGIPEGLETLRVTIPIRNTSGQDIKFVYGTLSSSASQIDFSEGDNFIYYGNISSGQYVVPDAEFCFYVNATSFSSAPFTLRLEYQDLSGNHYYQTFYFTYTFPAPGALTPNLVVDHIQIVDSSSGDGDGVFESGEEIDFFIHLRNMGTAACVNPKGILEQSTAWGTNVFTDLNGNYPDILAGSTEADTAAFDTDQAPMSFAGAITTPLRVWYGPDQDKYQDLSITLTVVPTPYIRLSPSTYDFGLITPGTPLAHVVTVRNRGSGDLVISGIDPNLSDTTITDITYPCTVAPGATTTFTMNVDTSALDGFITRTLSIHSNAHGQATVEFVLTGTVTAANPAASYTKLWEKLIDRDFNNIAVGDTDNDGKIEAVATSAGVTDNYVPVPAHIQIHEKVADDDFELVPTGTIPDLGGVPATHSLALADFNKNGYTDIVVLANSLYISGSKLPFRVLRYEATGNDTWVARTVAFNGGTTYGYTAMTVGDADDDGNQEIIVAREGDADPRVLVYEWNGSSFSLRWTSPVVLDRNGFNVTSIPVVKVADSDGDNHSEIIFGTDDAQLYIYESPAVNSYPPLTPVLKYEPSIGDYLGYCSLKDLVVADTDGDTRKEIIHVSEDGYLLIIESPGPDSWNTAAPEHYLLPGSMNGYCVAAGDTDNDGATEIVVGGLGGAADSHLCIYETIADNSHAVSWQSTEAEVDSEPDAVALINTNSTPVNEIVIATENSDPAAFPVLAHQESVDIQVVSNNITFDPETVLESGTVSISALVQNLSPSPLANVVVRFYSGDPASGGTQIGADQTIASISESGNAAVQVDWQPLLAQTYQIYVVVDPDDAIPESDNTANNKAAKTYVVLDNDISGPQISNIAVAEYGGDGDGAIEANEQVRISWSASDASGIGTSVCDIDGTVYAAAGSYEVIAGPFNQGIHNYTITVQDGDNSPAGTQQSGSFSVSSFAITVTGVSPVNGAINVSVRPAVEAFFDSSLNLSTITSSTVILRDSGLQVIPGSISYTPVGNKITFIPSRDLTNSAVYSLTLVGGSAGILSETGNGLVESYSWTFTVEPDVTAPIAVLSSPTAGQNVSGIVDIRGTAWDLNFLQYQVFYGEGAAPSAWTEITSAITVPVTGSLLCQWDTSALGAGQYTVKLVVLEDPPASVQVEDSVVVNIGKAATPVFTPEPGTYSSAQNITISCATADATIFYTTDGLDPTQSSTPYASPVHIDATTTLKARAYHSSMQPSEIASGVYEISGANSPPETPSPVSPADAATDQGLQPILTASAFSDPEGDEHSNSQWQVDDNGDFSTPVWDSGEGYIAGIQVTIPAGTLAVETTYFWRVRYKDIHDAWSEWSAAWSFTTVPPPGAFDLTSPASVTAVPRLTPSVTLTWTASANATSYDIYFGTSRTPGFHANTTETSLSVNVAKDQLYYWNVVAVNSGGTTYSTSGPFSFGTGIAFFSDFDDGTTQGWGFRDQSGLTSDNAHSAPNSIRNYSGYANQDEAECYKIFSPIEKGTAEFWYYAPSTRPETACIYLSSQDSWYKNPTVRFWLWISADGTVKYYVNGTEWTDFTSLPKLTFDVWSKISLTWNTITDKLVLRINGVNYGVAPATNAGGPICQLAFMKGSWSSVGTFAYIDDIKVTTTPAPKKKDLLATWDGQGVYYRNSDTGAWVRLASPATMIAGGDIDNDGIDDILGLWPSQGGIWARYSSNGAWAQLSSTARHIAAGDMNGDGRVDLVGTWDGQGVFYRNSANGAWVKLASPATLITAGDLDGDGTDDLIGIWPGQGGVWAKYSRTGAWSKISSTARDIAAGDMNGDGRDELLATWDGQGVYYRDSFTGAWTRMASEATQVTCGDLDGDGLDDLIGIWPTQGGVWVKYSTSGAWAKISSTAIDISAGLMRLQESESTPMAAGVAVDLPMAAGDTEGIETAVLKTDLSGDGPGGARFIYIEDVNLEPTEDPAAALTRIPGPGEPGFVAEDQKNLIPGEKMDDRARNDPREPNNKGKKIMK
ncbi:MAG: Ig-like domain-containing protein [Acidobacteriota bacterium]